MYGLNLRRFEPGEIIFKESSPGSDAYVIKSGSVGISKSINGKDVKIATLRQGEVFGEMALLEDGQMRTATVTAIEDSELVEISREKFLEFLERSPMIIATLLNTLVDRLKNTTAKLSEAPNPFLATVEILNIATCNNWGAIEYAPIVKSISGILALQPFFIEKILKKMEDLDLIQIVDSKNTGKAIVLKDRLTFVERARKIYFEWGEFII